MLTACQYCKGKKRTARFAVVIQMASEGSGTVTVHACGWHLSTAVTEAAGDPGLALVHVLPKEK